MKYANMASGRAHGRGPAQAALVALCALVALAVGGGVAESQTVREDFYVTDGVVNAELLVGNTLYIGGAFAQVGPASGGGVPRQNLAAIDITTGSVTAWDPEADGPVLALAESPGIVYAGGQFTTINGGTSRNRLAAIDATNGLATPWNPNANNEVRALVVSGGTVYAGGIFTTINGATRNRLAAIDAMTGLDTGWNPNPSPNPIVPSPSVDALAVSATRLYVGGRFGVIASTARLRLAAFVVNSPPGSLPTLDVNWNPNVSSAGPPYVVRALAMNGGTVYAGGVFGAIGGASRTNLAAIDTSPTGSAVISAWSPNPNGQVNALAVDGVTVYAGGTFTAIGGGAPRNGLAAIDTSGLATAWDPNPNGAVNALAASGGWVYAGGLFTAVGTTPRAYFAAFDPRSFTITASAGAHGSIEPSGAVSVAPGSSLTFTIAPDVCNDVADIEVDGVPVGRVTSYTFTTVLDNHTIHATFSAAQEEEGLGCDDGNPCTLYASCEAGVCVGSNPVVCIASDTCHEAGTCDTATGLCSNPVKADGSACSDGNACTQTDTCLAGVCAGANPVICTASDTCRDVGTCDSTLGVCSNPPKAPGSACDDGNSCTEGDSCVLSGPTCSIGENFDAVTPTWPPTYPDGWTSTSTSPPFTTWFVYPEPTAPSAPNAALGRLDYPGGSPSQETSLVSPTFTGTGLGELTFRHIPYGFTVARVLEIKIGVGDWRDIISAGGVWVGGGYDCKDDDLNSPLRGRRTWCGTTQWSEVRLKLPAASEAQSIQLRWRIAAPYLVSSDWWIDDIVFPPCPTTCAAGGAAPSGTGCDDGNACTIGATCESGICLGGTPPSCDDGNICTIDSCDPATSCVYAAVSCADGDACTYDTCDPYGGCQHDATCVDFQAGSAGPGGTVSTGSEATPTDQIETSVTTPSGGPITIQEGPVTESITGYDILDLRVVITADPATAENPLVLVFRIDASALPAGYSLSYLSVFKDGELVQDCSGDLPPSPCVSLREVLADSDVQVTVRTSSASIWNFGFPNCDDGNPCTDDSGSYPACVHVDNSAPCDDGNACTQTDSCQAGTCVGSNPVICTASDQCHDAGLCDEATGSCSDPAKSNGSFCSDGNACTQTDTCQSGRCTGGSFSWSGVLQPINIDGTSVFKLGSTIPAKFKLTGACAGNPNLIANIFFYKVTSTEGPVNEATSSSAADTGTIFRYSLSGDQYIFNLGTKGLSDGTWQLGIDLHDGAGMRTTPVGLRK